MAGIEDKQIPFNSPPQGGCVKTPPPEMRSAPKRSVAKARLWSVGDLGVGVGEGEQDPSASLIFPRLFAGGYA